MDRLHFFTPVRILCGQGYPVEEVDSVAEAMVFLRKWPTGRRGPVYQCALNCCSAALAGKMSAEEARKAFTGFARITRLLDDDMRMPISSRAGTIRTVSWLPSTPYSGPLRDVRTRATPSRAASKGPNVLARKSPVRTQMS